MIGGGLMVMVWYLANRYDFPVANARASVRERRRPSQGTFWPLLTPMILLGGILGGFFTPTEAAGVAAPMRCSSGSSCCARSICATCPDFLTGGA